jgi:hypothetical protein
MTDAKQQSLLGRQGPLILRLGSTAHGPPIPTPHSASYRLSRTNLLAAAPFRRDSIKFLLRDRDSRFTCTFDSVFAADGIRILTSPPGAPQANAICERMICDAAPRAARQDPRRQRASPTPKCNSNRASAAVGIALRCAQRGVPG